MDNLTDDFEEGWEEVHRGLTSMEFDAPDRVVQKHISDIDKILARLEKYIDNNYQWTRKYQESTKGKQMKTMKLDKDYLINDKVFKEGTEFEVLSDKAPLEEGVIELEKAVRIGDKVLSKGSKIREAKLDESIYDEFSIALQRWVKKGLPSYAIADSLSAIIVSNLAEISNQGIMDRADIKKLLEELSTKLLKESKHIVGY